MTTPTPIPVTSSSGTACATQKLKLGKITIEQIPERYREAVKKELGLPIPKISGTECIPPMKLIKRRKYFQNSITYKCTVSRGI